jgi:hypothetical protein
VRQRACGLRDDGRVAAIGLRFTGVQVRDSLHCQTGEKADEDVLRLGDVDRQSADRGRRIDDDEHGAGGFELLQHRPHLGFFVRQRLIEEDLAGRVQGDGVVFAFADVDTDEYVDAVVVFDHDCSRPLVVRWPGPWHQVSASTLRTTSALGLVEPLSAIT